ncbi:hypothetical protein JCM10207_001333 [Rhodosporidiobolus poonsookiae]
MKLGSSCYFRFRTTLDRILQGFEPCEVPGTPAEVKRWKQVLQTFVATHPSTAWPRRAAILRLARQQAASLGKGNPLAPSSDVLLSYLYMTRDQLQALIHATYGDEPGYHPGHNYRRITHRSAYHHGTTKAAWEAGRAW